MCSGERARGRKARGVAARARVWTDGSPAWEPCSSYEERKGRHGRGWRGGTGEGRRKEENEEGGVGGGGGGDDDDDGGSGAHPTKPWKPSDTSARGVLAGREGESTGTTGARFFRGRSEQRGRIDWQLWPSDDVFTLLLLLFPFFPFFFPVSKAQ